MATTRWPTTWRATRPPACATCTAGRATTKVWPHKDYPPIDVGVFELNRNPANHDAEVEQAAFEPGNMPPGKALQARRLSYPDAHRYRLMSADQQAQRIGNLLTPLKTVPRFIQVRQLGHFHKADPGWGERLAVGLGMALDEIDGRRSRLA